MNSRSSITGPVLLTCGMAVLIGCSSTPGGAKMEGSRSAEAVPVRIAVAVQKDVPVQIRAIGAVEPYSTVTIKSQVEGQLSQVHFEEGQRVKKGELLFTIDPRPFEAALRQAEANLARDAAEAKNAEVEADRKVRLFAQGFVSQDEYDQAQTTAVSLRAAVSADQAAVENTKLKLQYCYIRSPIDGRVGQHLVHEGNLVKANETTLAVLNQICPAYVAFSVPERWLPEIRRRAAENILKVQVSLSDHSATAADGELSFIDNAVDTTTGTVRLKGLFSNEDESLWPGQFVDVALTLSVQRDAVLIPAEAIQTGQQGKYVFVVKPDESVEVRPVVAGDVSGPDVVVSQGLQSGEKVVTDGQVRLAAGSKVRIKDEAQPQG